MPFSPLQASSYSNGAFHVATPDIISPLEEPNFTLPANWPNTVPFGYPMWVYGMSVLQTEAQRIPVDGTAPWPVAQVAALADALANTISIGSGIAAPQAGLPYQMFIMKTSFIRDNGATSASLPGASTLLLPEKNWTSPKPINQDPEQNHRFYQVFINPIIRPTSTDDTNNWFVDNEGCLSFPGYAVDAPKLHTSGFSRVKDVRDNYFSISANINSPTSSQTIVRYKSITFDYWTLIYDNNNQLILKHECVDISGEYDLNWVIQHETDHINGLLFTYYNAQTRTRTVLEPAPRNVALMQSIAEGESFHSSYPIVCCKPVSKLSGSYGVTMYHAANPDVLAPFAVGEYQTVPAGYNYPVWLYGMSVLNKSTQDIQVKRAYGESGLLTSRVDAMSQILASTVRTGVGIAAPQAGLPYAMFILKNAFIQSAYPPGTDLGLIEDMYIPGTNEKYQAFVNPVIIPYSLDVSNTWFSMNEGSLSFPGYLPTTTFSPIPNQGEAISVVRDRYNQFQSGQSSSPKATVRYLRFTLQYYKFPATRVDNPNEYFQKIQVEINGASDLNWVVQHLVDFCDGVDYTHYESDASNTHYNEKTRAVIAPAADNVAMLQSIKSGAFLPDPVYPIVYPG